MCDQKFIIGHTSKLLCLSPEISCMRAWHAECFRDKQLDIYDQDRESISERTGKLLCLRPEILCVSMVYHVL